MLNVLEAFFRRPILHLIPLGLMLALGAASVLNAEKSYISEGALSVTNTSLLADLTNSQQNAGLNFESPATVTARQINELLGTRDFLDGVIADAGLESMVSAGSLSRDEVRAWTGASADGDSIVRIRATTGNPELSYRLADSTINSYRTWVIDADVAQSTSTETSIESRVAEKQAAADAADNAVREKILEQPDVDIEERSLVDQQEFAILQDNATRAREQLVAAQDALDAAKLTTDQAAAVVEQRIRLLDAPEEPTFAAGGIKKAALSLIIFGVLGCVLSLISVVVSATLDRTIRVPNDVTSKFGVDVLAVVPETSR